MLETVENKIYAYQWSAILDKDTCNYCRSMDGKVIAPNDEAFHNHVPGKVHHGCRCMWVAIMKDDTNPPPITGIPKSLKPQSEVPPCDFHDIPAPLPGSSLLDIMKRLYGKIYSRKNNTDNPN